MQKDSEARAMGADKQVCPSEMTAGPSSAVMTGQGVEGTGAQRCVTPFAPPGPAGV